MPENMKNKIDWKLFWTLLAAGAAGAGVAYGLRASGVKILKEVGKGM